MTGRFDSIIVGAGAAGLAAAAFSRGRTLVLERLAKPGRKLLATGGGRCNVTHDSNAVEVMEAFGKRGRFATDALRAWDPGAIRAFLEDGGVECLVEADGRVFPRSGKSSDVLNVFLAAAEAAGARISCGVRVVRVMTDGSGGEACGVETSDGEIFHSPKVILATGGKCRPGLGSDGSGLEIASALGLEVVPVYPALGSLEIAEKWVGRLAGIGLPDASLRIAGRGVELLEARGPILFTHRGLSGPAALQISGDVAQALVAGVNPVSAEVAFAGGRDACGWREIFDRWRHAGGAKIVRNLLSESLPKALAAELCVLAGVPEALVAANLGREHARRLSELCSGCPLTITATDGWDAAMVMRGGVALKGLSPRTMESLKVRGLHCVGELVDLDAPCGGYNLTWAFASGRLAASALAR